jgi:hypothetical protein
VRVVGVVGAFGACCALECWRDRLSSPCPRRRLRHSTWAATRWVDDGGEHLGQFEEGGLKQSAIGRLNGLRGVQEFQEFQEYGTYAQLAAESGATRTRLAGGGLAARRAAPAVRPTRPAAAPA